MTSLMHEESKLTKDQEKRKLLVMKVQVTENNSIFRFSGFTEYLSLAEKNVWDGTFTLSDGNSCSCFVFFFKIV